MSNDTDITFQYPPELFDLLVDTIPLLNKAKRGVLLFFQGAGVPAAMYADLQQKLKGSPNDINKYDITRTILARLNTKGEPALRERREVLRRVAEFSNFDSCWPNDQLKAKGLVAAVRDVVNQKDAFTRINQERQQERDARIAEARRIAAAKQQRSARIDAAKREFYALFGADVTPQTRGKLLEAALNNIFKVYDILVREAFHLVGNDGEGIVEQIDGVVEIKGALYFVEVKWYKDPVGKPEVSEHLVRLMARAEGRGIFISASDFTAPAVAIARDFLQHKLIALGHVQEIVHLLERQEDLTEFFWKKVQAAQIHRNPYFNPFEIVLG
jgi:restriction system protein